MQSDLTYQVRFYRKKIVGYRFTAYAGPCICTVCVFDYPVPSPIRIFFVENEYVRCHDVLFLDEVPVFSNAMNYYGELHTKYKHQK